MPEPIGIESKKGEAALPPPYVWDMNDGLTPDTEPKKEEKPLELEPTDDEKKEEGVQSTDKVDDVIPEPEPELKPEPKKDYKKSAQERIDKEVAKTKELERKNEELAKRIAALEQSKVEPKQDLPPKRNLVEEMNSLKNEYRKAYSDMDFEKAADINLKIVDISQEIAEEKIKTRFETAKKENIEAERNAAINDFITRNSWMQKDSHDYDGKKVAYAEGLYQSGYDLKTIEEEVNKLFHRTTTPKAERTSVGGVNTLRTPQKEASVLPPLTEEEKRNAHKWFPSLSHAEAEKKQQEINQKYK